MGKGSVLRINNAHLLEGMTAEEGVSQDSFWVNSVSYSAIVFTIGLFSSGMLVLLMYLNELMNIAFPGTA